MKILKVVPYFHPSQYAGGIETLAEGWSKSLVTDYGCEVYILTSTGILGPISYLEDKYLAQQHIQVNRMRGFRVATRPVIPHLALKFISLINLNFWLYRHYVRNLCIYVLFSTISRYSR